MKTINVENIPEPVARALQAMVAALEAQGRQQEREMKPKLRERAPFRLKAGRALTELRRADIYADVG